MAVVYLHVGAPKTGTTYLQDRLWPTAAARRARCQLPGRRRGRHVRPALDLIDRRWGGHRDWSAASGTPSSAGSGGRPARPGQPRDPRRAPADQVARAMRDLDGEVHVVYSARDIGRQVPAEWQESIKHRNRSPFRALPAERAAGRAARPAMWFWRVQSLPDVLDRWTSERVHHVTGHRPAGRRPRDQLWRRYCRAFGIDPGWAPMPERPHQRLARHRRDRGRPRAQPAAAQAGLDSTPTARSSATSSSTDARPAQANAAGDAPAHAYGWAEEVAEEWIEWVERAGIDVVGDLADLRPVSPGDVAGRRQGQAAPGGRRRPRRPRRGPPRSSGQRGRGPTETPAQPGRAEAAWPVTGDDVRRPPSTESWVEHLRGGGTTPWRALASARRAPGGPRGARRRARHEPARAAPSSSCSVGSTSIGPLPHRVDHVLGRPGPGAAGAPAAARDPPRPRRPAGRSCGSRPASSRTSRPSCHRRAREPPRAGPAPPPAAGRPAASSWRVRRSPSPSCAPRCSQRRDLEHRPRRLPVGARATPVRARRGAGRPARRGALRRGLVQPDPARRDPVLAALRGEWAGRWSRLPASAAARPRPSPTGRTASAPGNVHLVTRSARTPTSRWRSSACWPATGDPRAARPQVRTGTRSDLPPAALEVLRRVSVVLPFVCPRTTAAPRRTALVELVRADDGRPDPPTSPQRAAPLARGRPPADRRALAGERVRRAR